MKYICAQPATLYFAWQIDTMLHSFVSVGIDMKDVHVVCSTDDGIDPYFDRLLKKYVGATFSFYSDTRVYRGYIPSIKQHLLAKHYQAFPYLEKETVFLHDCDIVLSKPIDFDGMLDDDVWYVSDTVSYLSYDYIKSKGDDVLNAMCKVANISDAILKINNDNSGGAQYLLKNVTVSYWTTVVEVANNLYREITKLNAKKVAEDPTHHPLQIWTAEMWAMLWVAWKWGEDTRVHKNLDFCWATDHVSKWDTVSIFHNAGVTAKDKYMFFKGAHQDQLPPYDLLMDRSKCSYIYYNILKNALLTTEYY